MFLAGLGLFASLFINNIKIQKEAHNKDADAKGEPEHAKVKVLR
jgi:hypothetical protein